MIIKAFMGFRDSRFLLSKAQDGSIKNIFSLATIDSKDNQANSQQLKHFLVNIQFFNF